MKKSCEKSKISHSSFLSAQVGKQTTDECFVQLTAHGAGGGTHMSLKDSDRQFSSTKVAVHVEKGAGVFTPAPFCRLFLVQFENSHESFGRQLNGTQGTQFFLPFPPSFAVWVPVGD